MCAEVPLSGFVSTISRIRIGGLSSICWHGESFSHLSTSEKLFCSAQEVASVYHDHRSFESHSITALQTWKQLPADIHHTATYSTFKHNLKTFLFDVAYRLQNLYFIRRFRFHCGFIIYFLGLVLLLSAAVQDCCRRQCTELYCNCN